jgi:hypothetical protein
MLLCFQWLLVIEIPFSSYEMWAIVKSDALGMCKVVEDEVTCIVNLLDDLNIFM